MSEQAKLKPCPFCGSDENLEIREAWVVAGYKWFVSCADCWAHGPLVDTKDAAVTEWNGGELRAQLALVERYGADQWRRGNAGKDPQEFAEWRKEAQP